MPRFQRVDRSAPPGFRNLHPSGRRKRRFRRGPDLPPAAGVDGAETKYIRCKKCGYINNVQINQRGSGWGNEIPQHNTDILEYLTYDEAYNYTPVQDIRYDGWRGKWYNDVDVGAGCAFCGSSEY